jgi:hypothetical protein
VALGGILGGAAGFVGGLLAGRGLDPAPGWGEAVASGVGATVGAAGGAWAIGCFSRENGQLGWTLLGASIGSLVGVPLFWHYTQERTWDDDRFKVAFAAAFTLPAAGAVTGYHLSRRSPEFGDRFFDRLDYPSVALLPSSRTLAPPSFDVRLLNMRL